MFLVSGPRFEKHSESESLDLEAASHMEKSALEKGFWGHAGSEKGSELHAW